MSCLCLWMVNARCSCAEGRGGVDEGRVERQAYPLWSLWKLRNIYHIQLKPHVYVWEYIKCHLPNHLPCYKLRQHQQCYNAKEHSAVFQFDIKWVLLPNSSYKHEKNSCKPSGGADGLRGFPAQALCESYRVYIFFAVKSWLCYGCCWGEQTFCGWDYTTPWPCPFAMAQAWMGYLTSWNLSFLNLWNGSSNINFIEQLQALNEKTLSLSTVLDSQWEIYFTLWPNVPTCARTLTYNWHN